MLTPVPTTPKSFKAYQGTILDEDYEEIQRLARGLRGVRVLNINATAFGGGVAEILGTLVPLMNDLGLHAEWQVIKGAEEFFRVTKAVHNSLQGMYQSFSPDMWEVWQQYNRSNAESLVDDEYDIVVVHDPQPVGLLHFLTSQLGGRKWGRWVWRCHIDLTEAQVDVWDYLRPYVELYDAAIFTLRDFVREDLEHPRIVIAPPGIDPLSPKNIPLPVEQVEGILRRYGVEPERPMVCQVSRFDPWKDPLGVIDAYRIVKQQVPTLQLVMIASMAHDDPEGWSYWEKTVRRAGEDYDIHLLSNLFGVGNVEVNAFQTAAKVAVQKSRREGFGLSVAEALWKGRPVVAGYAGGIPLQVLYGRTGYLVETTAECADRVLYLLQHPQVAERMGREGREHVRGNFLITRYLRDYLRLFSELLPRRRRSRYTGISLGHETGSITGDGA